MRKPACDEPYWYRNNESYYYTYPIYSKVINSKR